MRQLQTMDLLPEFRRLLGECESVDIAVAWATDCNALNAFLKRAKDFKRKARVVVGISGNSTSPQALMKLSKKVELTVTDGTKGVFHPKFYLFKMPRNRKAICWIGSANFSEGGFKRNDELVHEFEDSGTAQAWFEELFERLRPGTKSRINSYIRDYVPPSRLEIRSPAAQPPTRHPISLMLRCKPGDWNSYFAALEKCDAYWLTTKSMGHFSVFDEVNSYFHTISEGHRVISRRNWTDLEYSDVEILMGFNDRHSGTAYGLLGSMKGAGKATNVFLEPNGYNLRIRAKIDKILAPLKSVRKNQFADLAGESISEFKSLNARFGPGVSTRLITLARPDLAVSVNDGSRYGLAKLTGLPPSTLGSPRNYPKLLNWVFQQPWHSSDKPNDEYEARVWEMRAALIDSFVYGY